VSEFESGLSDDAESIGREFRAIDAHLREGRFQRSLCLLTAGASLASGLEVAYEHYRGSYGQRVMYTPVVLSGILTAAGLAGFFSGRFARSGLRAASIITLGDAALGFYFHVRGIARKPGSWSLPLTNITMGPPLFAPLLFGTAAYLGVIASYLRRETDTGAPEASTHLGAPETAFAQDVREGRFQQHLLAVTAASAALSGAEALYSHYKGNFRYRSQWLPVVLAPLLAIASLGGMRARPVATRVVPPVASAAMVVAGIGFIAHARGIVRRPGGIKHLPYNIMYGPPIFAPLLFGAAGGLGLLASRLRRSHHKS
jgi:hypothetical protein